MQCAVFTNPSTATLGCYCASEQAKGDVAPPGAVHLLNGLYDANLDHQPVLALVGQQARSAMGSHYQQDLDLQSLFKDVAGAYVETAVTPTCRISSTGPIASASPSGR